MSDNAEIVEDAKISAEKSDTREQPATLATAEEVNKSPLIN